MSRSALVLLCALGSVGCQPAAPCECPDVGGGDARVDADRACPPCDASCDARPEPEPGDEAALWRIMEARRSFRDFGDEPITREDVEALLRAAQGITLPGVATNRPDAVGFRTVPSAGATYPLEIYVAADRVEGLDPGLYWYNAQEDSLSATGLEGALAPTIAAAALDQAAIHRAAAVFVIASIPERTTGRYGSRGLLYVAMEVGHAAQNLLLMATARGVEHVPIGAFDPREMRSALGLPEEQDPEYLIPVGQGPR